ncbi:hypothetical protein F441_08796 [Phytophthora nicotianae CJ01A1]|uniref:Uncharacterized protein n=5 Tax=Phytophthora nicotianae TaxID=4792 RepID=V9F911_PHYNI|nr:hypothetical protein F443_08817 [Phytophthora nicotianae P1569]ETK86787.1 hypothetical protein L915_08652 [Phytophthora nicotianae]ETO75547.1 hypothetical protein F444_08886 [Phytophthora nicotianae P1976]ETP16652.1 hypothetical protein F441_08796 [Phytophthora nicotianae CJ01A1]ETL40202.1 hypothetical protein L916_08581 [Phytophthora nicotianae]
MWHPALCAGHQFPVEQRRAAVANIIHDLAAANSILVGVRQPVTACSTSYDDGMMAPPWEQYR